MIEILFYGKVNSIFINRRLFKKRLGCQKVYTIIVVDQNSALHGPVEWCKNVREKKGTLSERVTKSGYKNAPFYYTNMNDVSYIKKQIILPDAVVKQTCRGVIEPHGLAELKKVICNK